MFTFFIRPHLRLALFMAAALLVAGTLSRVAFMLWFTPLNADLAIHDWIEALWLGIRYDVRVALLTFTLAWLLSSLPWLGKHLRPPRLRRAWWTYWMLACTLWAIGVISDAGHYAYLTKRLSSTLFSLARDGSEATGMVWQSYPVIWISLALLLWLLLSHWMFARLWSWSTRTIATPNPPHSNKKWVVIASETIVVLLALFLIHGKFSQYPLRWSDSVVLANAFAQQSALNPLHNLYDTWTFREQGLNDAQMRPDADAIRGFVGLPPLRPEQPISFLRSIAAPPQSAGKPPMNVVLVLLESFAGHKVGALGSPMGATPSFDALAKEGVLFTRMMSAHAHTARGVFASVTGIPDVSLYSTASRNPAATNQHTIINEFKPHHKYYFIGGSTSWANVRGVLAANIDGVDIFEEGRLKSPVEDVWGVSDRNLFKEANEQFREQTAPFFAMIQTGGNHRPYNIPQADLAEFMPRTPSAKELEEQGFISLEEYRSFAYLDWCIGQFMQQARKEKYFDNTIFAFIGDHGIIGSPGPHLPSSWKELAITQGHTPLLIYAPKHVAARRIDHWAQQVDVLPTLASLAGIAYRNTTLGRDLLDPQFNATRVAFEFQFTGIGEKGVLVDHYLFVDRKPQAAFDILSTDPTANLYEKNSTPPEFKALSQQWSSFPSAYANAALYLQTHNPRFHD
jgi:phosphoglycerol transferase MdoB-like AlkP superfamily enzyme